MMIRTGEYISTDSSKHMKIEEKFVDKMCVMCQVKSDMKNSDRIYGDRYKVLMS